MALKQIRIGSLPGFQYDDADYDAAVETSEPMKAGPPVDANDVLRLGDLTIFPVSAANIDNPTELGATVGNEGDVALVYSSVPATGLNEYTLYAYDASGPAVAAPYVMDASGVGSERWIAIAGKYRISTIMNTLTTKNPPLDADLAIYRDSVGATWNLVTSTWTQIKAFLKTYFDTQYLLTTGGVITGPITLSTVEDWRYAGAIADDDHVDLPTILANYAAIVNVVISSIGVIDANATFMVDSTGTVTPQVDSGNCVYNIDTDVKLCIGTAAGQNPLIIKYRLGSAVAKIMITMMYVKA